MKREHFAKVVKQALDSLPQEFRNRIQNVAVLVEDVPPNQPSPHSGQPRRLLLGVFHGVPTIKKSIFNLPSRPDHIVLYQKNIEAVCSSEAEVQEQIRLTARWKNTATSKRARSASLVPFTPMARMSRAG
jgi:predicted Zn-dependent protease with MMP-like domain